jgi:phosphatidylserine/phosphatidylglycerophosphate/cardiolipin synthase-like enzyme
MRASTSAGDLRFHVVAGTHVVLLGFDVAPAARDTLLGFAVQRAVGDDDFEFLPNFLRFAGNDHEGGPWGTDRNPLQAFLWGDYGVAPGQRVRYRASIVTGNAAAPTLTQPTAELEVTTELDDDDRHGIWFNRGIAGSQAYTRKFGGRSPLRDGKAQAWLSRGLQEALLSFIGRAEGPGKGLRGAFYEFTHPPVLDALRDAARRGADVRLVVADPADNRGWPESTAWENAEAIRGTQGMAYRHPFASLITARRATTHIAHNKFLVFVDQGAPKAVWTGSTNITDGAVWGHSNLGHLVEDAGIAAEYLAFWENLKQDPDDDASRAWADEHSPVPDVADDPPFLPPGVHAVFSPHSESRPIERYISLMRHARQAMFLSAPFGIVDQLEPELETDRGFARYVLLDKEDEDMAVLLTDPQLQIGVGAYLGQPGGYRQFLQEHLTGLNPRVRFIHTKYLLVDPLTDHPVVLTGSANFSMASTVDNDENMLWISGDGRVADVYLTEFMRLFMHFRFRDAVGARTANERTPGPDDPDVKATRYLDETPGWAAPFFVDNTPKSRERLLFSGQA